MGKLAHPLPPRKTTLEDDILVAMDALETKLGKQAFCVWLASSTPAAWVLDAPLTEVRDGLRNKLSEIQETN